MPAHGLQGRHRPVCPASLDLLSSGIGPTQLHATHHGPYPSSLLSRHSRTRQQRQDRASGVCSGDGEVQTLLSKQQSPTWEMPAQALIPPVLLPSKGSQNLPTIPFSATLAEEPKQMQAHSLHACPALNKIPPPTTSAACESPPKSCSFFSVTSSPISG